jgi:hypothetical protein
LPRASLPLLVEQVLKPFQDRENRCGFRLTKWLDERSTSILRKFVHDREASATMRAALRTPQVRKPRIGPLGRE